MLAEPEITLQGKHVLQDMYVSQDWEKVYGYPLRLPTPHYDM